MIVIWPGCATSAVFCGIAITWGARSWQAVSDEARTSAARVFFSMSWRRTSRSLVCLASDRLTQLLQTAKHPAESLRVGLRFCVLLVVGVVVWARGLVAAGAERSRV